MHTITLTQSDYTNITKAFFFYLENEKELKLTKKEIDSILKTNNKINNHEHNKKNIKR
jgi:hypothetical protein